MKKILSARSSLILPASSTVLNAQQHHQYGSEGADPIAVVEQFGAVQMPISCAPSVQVRLPHLAFRDAGDTGEWNAMRLKIVQVGEPVLRSLARQLTREEILSDEIRRLIRDMRETMRDAPGVGLAAPQVGMTLQLAVIED